MWGEKRTDGLYQSNIQGSGTNKRKGTEKRFQAKAEENTGNKKG